MFELLEDHHHDDCGCHEEHRHTPCDGVHRIHGEGFEFTRGQFIYWDSTTKTYLPAIEGKCDLMVVGVDVYGTWFEAVNYGEFPIRNYTLQGGVFIDSTGKLTNEVSNTKVGFIENGHLYLLIERTVAGAVNADWTSTTGLSKILNKPSIFSGSWNDLSDKPDLFSGDWNDLSNKPSLFSGSWNDLNDKPSIPTLDHKVKLSDSDVEDFLGNKIKQGANVTITEKTGTGGVKYLEIAASGGSGGGSSIPMIAGTGLGDDGSSSSLVGNSPLNASRASAHASMALGLGTQASNVGAHAEGVSTLASGDGSHAEGRNTTASGTSSHAEGESNVAALDYQHVEGVFALDDTGYAGTNPKLHKVGGGSSTSDRKDVNWVRKDGTIGTSAFGTGSGSANLGSNCPAVDPSKPYTWLKFELPDGTVGYVPFYK